MSALAPSQAPVCKFDTLQRPSSTPKLGLLKAPKVPTPGVAQLWSDRIGPELAKFGPTSVKIGPKLAESGPSSTDSGRVCLKRGRPRPPKLAELARRTGQTSPKLAEAGPISVRIGSILATLSRLRANFGPPMRSKVGRNRPSFGRSRSNAGQHFPEVAPKLADVGPIGPNRSETGPIVVASGPLWPT